MAKKKAKKQTKISRVAAKVSPVVLPILGKLDITITKTADGSSNYVQIATGASAMPVNIVLLADEIEVSDHREKT